MTVGLVNVGDRLLRALPTAVSHAQTPGSIFLVIQHMVIQQLVISAHHNGYGTKNDT